MNPRIQLRKPTLATAITSLLLLTLTNAQAQTTIISDFNDGIPDWDEKPPVRGVDFSETGGHLVASGNIPAGNDCITSNLSLVKWWHSLAVNDGEVLTLSVDLIQASHNDVLLGLQYVLPETGGGGYGLFMDEDEIWLTKFQWVACGGAAPFFYEQLPTKSENVGVAMELKRNGADLEITVRVHDKDANDAILFERTVVDTVAVDATLPSFRGYTWWPDSGPPIFNATSVEIAVINVAKTPQSGVSLALDNFVYERMPALTVQKAVLLSWPNTFPGMEVYGAPTVDGPWTMLTEPVVESAGELLMTVPSPSAGNYEFYRLQQP